MTTYTPKAMTPEEIEAWKAMPVESIEVSAQAYDFVAKLVGHPTIEGQDAANG